MTQVKIGGENFSVDCGVVYFFGASSEDGDNYALHCDIGPTRDSALNAVRRALYDNSAITRDRPVAYIFMGPQEALSLYREGIISVRHLGQATEPSSKIVMIPNVFPEATYLTICVIGDMKHGVAAADAQGVVIT